MSRQTKTFLMERFREMGIRPATRHGQNFLIDLNLHRLIVDSAELTDQDVVLEVGTGKVATVGQPAEAFSMDRVECQSKSLTASGRRNWKGSATLFGLSSDVRRYRLGEGIR